MVSFGSGLGIILHLAFLAQLLFIMDEQSVPVHSVPASDASAFPLHYMTLRQCLRMLPLVRHPNLKFFLRRNRFQTCQGQTEPETASPGAVALQQAVDAFHSGSDIACIPPISPDVSLQPPSPSYDADFEWVDSLGRNEEHFRQEPPRGMAHGSCCQVRPGPILFWTILIRRLTCLHCAQADCFLMQVLLVVHCLLLLLRHSRVLLQPYIPCWMPRLLQMCLHRPGSHWLDRRQWCQARIVPRVYILILSGLPNMLD